MSIVIGAIFLVLFFGMLKTIMPPPQKKDKLVFDIWEKKRFFLFFVRKTAMFAPKNGARL